MQSTGPYIALAALAVAIVLAGIAYWSARRQARLEAGQRAILGTHEPQDLVEHALELEDQVRNLREAVTILTDEVERYRHDLDASLSNIGVVRFDAFRDSGGEQSASIALLDNYRSGCVISVFAAREFARIYVKYLDHGVADRPLAPEEEEAVRRAVPQALPRGELSRPPVSSFPREVRETIEQVRRAAAESVAEEQAAAAAADKAAAMPPRQTHGTDEAELGFDWVEETPQPGGPPQDGPEAPGGAGTRPQAAAAGVTLQPGAAPQARPVPAGQPPATPGQTSSGQTPVGASDGTGGSPPPGPGVTQPVVSAGAPSATAGAPAAVPANGPAGPPAAAVDPPPQEPPAGPGVPAADGSPPGKTPNARERHDDWGGDDLDF